MKKTIFFFIFFLLVPIVLAAPPQTNVDVQSGVAGIVIEYPAFDFYPPDTEVKLNFHVHNSSFSELTNTTTQCGIHIYNNTGGHLTNNKSINFDADDNDFYYTINKSQLNEGQKYAYVLYCNNTLEAGFLSMSFEITPDAIDTSKQNIWLIAVVILLGIVTLTFVLIGAFQKSKPFQIFFNLLAILMCVIDLFISGKIADVVGANKGLTHNLYTIYAVGLYIFEFLLIVAVIILFFWVIDAIKKWKDETKLKKEDEWLSSK